MDPVLTPAGIEIAIPVGGGGGGGGGSQGPSVRLHSVRDAHRRDAARSWPGWLRWASSGPVMTYSPRVARDLT